MAVKTERESRCDDYNYSLKTKTKGSMSWSRIKTKTSAHKLNTKKLFQDFL